MFHAFMLASGNAMVVIIDIVIPPKFFSSISVRIDQLKPKSSKPSRNVTLSFVESQTIYHYATIVSASWLGWSGQAILKIHTGALHSKYLLRDHVATSHDSLVTCSCDFFRSTQIHRTRPPPPQKFKLFPPPLTYMHILSEMLLPLLELIDIYDKKTCIMDPSSLLFFDIASYWVC